MNIACLLLAAIITNTAPDGVNQIYTDTDTGATMSTMVYVRPPNDVLFATLPETVFVQVDTDKVQSVVCMSEEYYAYLTNWMTKISTLANKEWKKQHATESGRREWHGNSVKHWVDRDAKQQITEYEDGYRLVEPMKATRKTYTETPPTISRAVAESEDKMPSRLASLIKERKSAKTATAREVTHTHVANGGAK